MIQIDLTDRPAWLVLFSVGLAIFVTALAAAVIVLTGWLPPWSLVFVFILSGAFPWARLAVMTLEVAEHQRDAQISKAEAERILAERSWQGQPAESADTSAAAHARELAIEWLEASTALPCCPADGRKIAGWRELGWSPKRWQAAADTLRAETTIVVGGLPHKQGTYTATR